MLYLNEAYLQAACRQALPSQATLDYGPGDGKLCRDGAASDAVWRFPWRAFKGDGPD